MSFLRLDWTPDPKKTPGPFETNPLLPKEDFSPEDSFGYTQLSLSSRRPQFSIVNHFCHPKYLSHVSRIFCIDSVLNKAFCATRKNTVYILQCFCFVSSYHRILVQNKLFKLYAAALITYYILQ